MDKWLSNYCIFSLDTGLGSCYILIWIPGYVIIKTLAWTRGYVAVVLLAWTHGYEDDINTAWTH
jgi:hypothetical protein